MKLKPQFTVKIKGDTWKIYSVSAKTFYKHNPNCTGSTAAAVYNHAKKYRTIWFIKGNASLNTIIHELCHAFLSYKDFTGKSYGRVEEDICEVMGAKLPIIHRLANHIKSKLSPVHPTYSVDSIDMTYVNNYFWGLKE